ncbi:MAG: HD-GYP domain-containing protein [Planctomycetota bacterium]
MIRLPVARLAPDQVLARAAPDPDTPTADRLCAGTALTADSIADLERAGTEACWIRCAPASGLEDRLPVDLDNAQRAACAAVQAIFTVLEQNASARVDIAPADQAVQDLARVIREHPTAPLHFTDLPSVGHNLARHSAWTAYLALVIGVRLEAYVVKQRNQALGGEHARETNNLGLGALLHDIGWAGLAPDLRLRRHEELDRRQVAETRKHPEIGFDLIRKEVEPSAANIALNHHQRWDGEGYPRRSAGVNGTTETGLSGQQIPVFSRITAVANQYRRLLEQPLADGRMRPAVQALFEMRFAVYREWFDPEVETMLYSIAPPFPLGHGVQLSGGQRAVVTDFNPQAPCQPTVHVLTDRAETPLPDGKTFSADLSRTHEAHIRRHYDEPVARYLF